MLIMNSGDAARRYLAEHGSDIHPATGRPPIILYELKNALNGGHVTEAEEEVHNYQAHGRVEAGTAHCGPACTREAEAG